MFALFCQISFQICYVLTTVTALLRVQTYLGFRLSWIFPATWSESHIVALSVPVPCNCFSFFQTDFISLLIFVFLSGCLYFYTVFMSWPERSTVFLFALEWTEVLVPLSTAITHWWVLAPLVTVVLLREVFTELASGLLQAFIES